MSFYQITINNLEGFDSKQIHDVVTTKLGIGDWWHYLPSVYIVVSAATSYSLASKIIQAFPGLNFLITKIDINDYNGYLDKRAWEWLANKAKLRGVKYVPHASSPLMNILSGQKLPPITTSKQNTPRDVLLEAILRSKLKK